MEHNESPKGCHPATDPDKGTHKKQIPGELRSKAILEPFCRHHTVGNLGYTKGSCVGLVMFGDISLPNGWHGQTVNCSWLQGKYEVNPKQATWFKKKN